jgi:hypothetical protein
MFPDDQYESDAYSLFSDRIGREEFSQRFRALDETRLGRFIRACYLLQKASKFKASEPDISMSLLCSGVESNNATSSSLIFKDWLVKKKLDQLSGKSADEVRKNLDLLYKEYIESETEREGASYNFKRFLVKYCPQKFRNPPMIVYPKARPVARRATFEEALSYVYSKFRSLFVHQGIGRLERPAFAGTLVYSSLLDKHGSNHYGIDIQRVLDWFEWVVLESLWGWFLSVSTGSTATSTKAL